MNKLKFLLILLLTSVPLSLFAGDFTASFGLAQTQGSVQTKSSESTDSATLSFVSTSLELGGDYFLLPNLSLYTQFILPLQSSIDANMTGIDIGGRYFISGLGKKTDVKNSNIEFKSLPARGTHIFGGFSSRNFGLSDRSLTFLGAEAGVGYDHYLSSNWALRLDLSVQYHQNASSRTMNSINLGVGFIYPF